LWFLSPAHLNTILLKCVIKQVYYAKGTVDLSFNITLRPILSDFEVIKDIRENLLRHGNPAWGFEDWPLALEPYSKSSLPKDVYIFDLSLGNSNTYYMTLLFSAELKNQNGKVIGDLSGDLYFHEYTYKFIMPTKAQYEKKRNFTFRGVNANDITDTLSISIVRIRDEWRRDVNISVSTRDSI
jgi:hypothetical protein